MKQTPMGEDLARQIDRYNRELRNASKRSQLPADTDPTPSVSAEKEPQPSPATPSAAPQPPVLTELTPAPDTPTFDLPGGDAPVSPAYPLSGTGYLQIQVFTAREATPLPGAHVTVCEAAGDQAHLLATAQTDSSGFSPLFSLPSVSADLSRQPGAHRPYTVYDITAEHPGYFRVRTEQVPVFSGVVSRQPVFLTPLPETEDEQPEILYPTAPPAPVDG